MSLDTPLEADDFSELVDWLELESLLSLCGVAKVKLIENALGISSDDEEKDIGLRDEQCEILNNGISEEVKRRVTSLGETVYPFNITRNGDALVRRNNVGYGASTYLISLVINHSWTNGKLSPPSKMTDAELNEGRNHFEVLATVAAIGMTRGPGFLLGTNRAGAEALLDRIRHICLVSGEGRARDALHPAAPQNANDDKIDIISVEMEPDGPPARRFIFGQSAAGADYENKPIRNEIKRFIDIWFDRGPANTEAAMFIPALLGENELDYHTRRLGHLLHRLRMPLYAQTGATLLAANAKLANYVGNINSPIAWFDEYVHRAREA